MTRTRTVEVAPERDTYGNADGSQFDLAVDGAFEGQTVAVLQLYAFSFENTREALKRKGFGVYRWNSVPPIDEFRASLKKACQFWLISDHLPHLTEEHIAEIKRFFDSGRGVYIWGDNEPFYADANRVGMAWLTNHERFGDKVVGMKK